MTLPIRVLALDLEGTLLSNAISCFPRPGLHDFLQFCRSRFPRVVLFTSVPEPRARKITSLLAAEGSAPNWFALIEYVSWPIGNGGLKDLRLIRGVSPAEVLLVEDQSACVHPEQKNRWVPVAEFLPPFTQDDRELERVRGVLLGRIQQR